jgi:hypothetical protein
MPRGQLAVLRTVSKLIGVVNKAVDWFNGLNERQQKIIITIAGVVAAIGPLLLIGGQLMTALQALIPVIVAVNAAMAANPIGLVVIAVAALAAGAVLLIKHWDEVKAFFVGLWEKLKGLVDKVPDWVLVMMPFVGLPLLIIRNWEGIKEFVKGIMDAIKYHLVDRFVEVIEKIKGGIEKVTGFFKDMFDKVVGESYVPDMVDRIGTEFARLVEIMKNKAEEAAGSTKTIFGYLADYMENNFEQSMKSTMESVWTSTGNFASKIKDTIKGLLADMLRGLGREYAALAAAFFFKPFQALKYLAAAVALFTAAGAVERLATGADFVTNGPQMVMVGDNPGGKERVQVTPLSSPNINGPKMAIVGPLVLEIDSTPIYKGMLKATEDGFALIDENAIVRQ